jgi:hypothetical protein
MTPEEKTDRRCEDVVREAERAARIARALTDGALANQCVREFIEFPDRDFPGMWTEAKVRANPPVRVEFDHAIVLGGMGEALAAARLRRPGDDPGKVSTWRWKPSFGELIGILPLEPADPVGEFHVMYLYKGTSPYNRRVEQRRYLKKRLGTGHRSQVGEAMRYGKREFLTKLPPETAKRIASRLNLDPGTFWRVARGKAFIPQIEAPPVPTLFDAGDVIKKRREKRSRVSLPVIQTPSLFDAPPPADTQEPQS